MWDIYYLWGHVQSPRDLFQNYTFWTLSLSHISLLKSYTYDDSRWIDEPDSFVLHWAHRTIRSAPLSMWDGNTSCRTKPSYTRLVFDTSYRWTRSTFNNSDWHLCCVISYLRFNCVYSLSFLQERRGAERRTGFGGAAVSSLYQEEMIRYLHQKEHKHTHTCDIQAYIRTAEFHRHTLCDMDSKHISHTLYLP